MHKKPLNVRGNRYRTHHANKAKKKAGKAMPYKKKKSMNNPSY